MLANVSDFIPKTAVSPVDIPPPTPCTFQEAVKSFKLTTIDELTTDHMSAAQRKQFNHLITRVREWRKAVHDNPGQSMMVMSKQVGIGKTHLARSVVSSFSAIIGELMYLDGKPQFSLEKRARLYTSRELIAHLGGDEQRELWQIVPRSVECLVIDDLGREGYLDFVKADQQAEEKRARYFHLINHLYQRQQNGRYPVSLFITTNLNEAECKDLLGDATWSRLLEMCPRGYIMQVKGLDDYRPIKSGR